MCDVFYIVAWCFICGGFLVNYVGVALLGVVWFLI